VERLRAQNILAEYLKFPIYDIKPSGPMINNYLREGNKYGLSAREIQMAYALNRTQFEPILTAKLAQGINIIAEDYVGNRFWLGESAPALMNRS